MSFYSPRFPYDFLYTLYTSYTQTHFGINHFPVTSSRREAVSHHAKGLGPLIR